MKRRQVVVLLALGAAGAGAGVGLWRRAGAERVPQEDARMSRDFANGDVHQVGGCDERSSGVGFATSPGAKPGERWESLDDEHLTRVNGVDRRGRGACQNRPPETSEYPRWLGGL